MTISFQPVHIASLEEGEGQLAFRDELLVAVLVRLSDLHEEAAGRWFLEAGFGQLDGVAHPTFAHLDEAAAWLDARLAQPL